MAQNQSGSTAPTKIIGGVVTSDGSQKPIRQSDPINPGGANPAAILPSNSKVPAPTTLGEHAALPSGSFAPNLKPSGNGPSAGISPVTDKSGNYIPIRR
jgi:hypothetical protein